jgi:hypothetical protein
MLGLAALVVLDDGGARQNLHAAPTARDAVVRDKGAASKPVYGVILVSPR